MKVFNRIMLILSVLMLIAAVASGLYFLGKVNALPEATGTVLTDEFIRSDCTRTTYFFQMLMSFIAAFTSFISVLYSGISLLRERKTGDSALFAYYNIRKVFTSIMMIIMTCVVFFFPFSRTNAVLHNDPEVVMAYFDHKYEDYDSDGDKRYYIVYSNGTRSSVSKTTYDEADPGDYYYLVFFGDKHVRTYDGSRYTLPQ